LVVISVIAVFTREAPVCESDEDLCLLCENGSTCSITGGGYKCECPDGFSGVHCEINSSCDSNPCSNGGICDVSDEDGKVCTCPSGYYSDLCDVDSCTDDQCNSGTCAVTGTSFSCSCPTGASGDNCEVDSCSSNPCQNSADCHWSTALTTHSTCDCTGNYVGSECQKQSS